VAVRTPAGGRAVDYADLFVAPRRRRHHACCVRDEEPSVGRSGAWLGVVPEPPLRRLPQRERVGGKKAPDLGQGQDRGFSPYNLAALMWNHAPAMWGATARESVTVPAMDEQQAADLFVYFYAAGYFETPGDAKRGKQLFIARRCGQCHGTDSPVRAGIRPVAEWDSVWDPSP